MHKYDIDYWQVLPLSPPDAFGSPYASNSAFAAWEEWIEGYQDIGTYEQWMTDWGYYSAIRSVHDNKEWFHWPKELKNKEKELTSELEDLDRKISLVKNNDLDYLDILFREKFRYGTKDEIIIKLK